MKKTITLLISIFVIVIAIEGFAQKIKLPENLKNDAEVMSVKGTQGIMINQVVSFGDFKTSKIKKGWTKTSTFTSNATSVSKSSQKFSFTQYGPENTEAEVACVGELSKIDIELIKNLFSIGTDFTNCFSGSVSISENDTWEFIIVDPDIIPENNSSSGFIRKGNEELFEVFIISELEGKKIPKFLQSVIGFEFRQNGEPIGAVSTYNKGEVIIKNDISQEYKLVIASISTSLLVKANLRDQ